MIIKIIIYLSIGLFSGLGSGMLGIGGGALRIPLLNLAGMPLLQAFGINFLVIPFSSGIGAFTHRKNIKYKFAIFIIMGGLVGSIAGAFFAGMLYKVILAFLFLLVSLLTVTGIYLGKILPKLSKNIRPNPYNLAGGTFLINLVTGMRGGSGGSLFPAYLKFLNINIHNAIATSLFSTIFTALSAFVIYMFKGNVDFINGIAVTIGAISGSKIGSHIALKTKPKWLELILSLVAVTLAISVVVKALI